ncbi:hypothetical protein QBC44DRAFT_131090 [Cladorrhinum sp. PSN332]|nr:hypothetical protein QBC44DRAFT_131090 [Cladorrhinum sp. PSN332]
MASKPDPTTSWPGMFTDIDWSADIPRALPNQRPSKRLPKPRPEHDAIPSLDPEPPSGAAPGFPWESEPGTQTSQTPTSNHNNFYNPPIPTASGNVSPSNTTQARSRSAPAIRWSEGINRGSRDHHVIHIPARITVTDLPQPVRGAVAGAYTPPEKGKKPPKSWSRKARPRNKGSKCDPCFATEWRVRVCLLGSWVLFYLTFCTLYWFGVCGGLFQRKLNPWSPGRNCFKIAQVRAEHEMMAAEGNFGRPRDVSAPPIRVWTWQEVVARDVKRKKESITEQIERTREEQIREIKSGKALKLEKQIEELMDEMKKLNDVEKTLKQPEGVR